MELVVKRIYKLRENNRSKSQYHCFEKIGDGEINLM